MSHKLLLVFIAAVSSPPVLARQSEHAAINPIRRVVTMLQMMQKKVQAEGEKEQELFDKYMCWCQTGGADLKKSIEEAETKIPQLESTIKEVGGEKVQLMADVKQHRIDRDAAKAAMAEATAIREKEAAAFAQESSEDKSNIDAMARAIAALEKGMTGSFLQTSGAAVLRRLTMTLDLADEDRETLTAFLSQGQTQGEDYAPQSGQITGILKQMKDTMEASLAEATAAEEKAIADYKALMVAKKKEVDALQKSIEEKLKRIGDMGVELVNMMEDLDDTKKSLEEDKAFLADLEKNCATKEAEWAARQKVRAAEIVALADTIKLLNDDDALELFKKTLPSPGGASLLQVQMKSKVVRNQALNVLKGATTKDPRLDLIALALHGKKVNFDKVIGMIDDMVALLGKEQKDDDEKKEYCETEFDTAEDEKKRLARAISDLEKAIEENTAAVETLTTEIADLVQGIKDLDKQVAEATEQRKAEHEDFVANQASNNAAKDLLTIARNRLNKFYNPKLYKPPPKRELTEEERITVNLGGTAPPTQAPGGIAGTGVTALISSREAPPPPPETFGAYAKKSQESNGVIAMIDLLMKDLTTEIQESEFEEKDAQSDYEKLVTDSAAKRAADTESIAEKKAAKADLEASLQKDGEDKKAKMAEAMANAEYTHNLHLECDWLIENFSLRAEMRAGEVDSLKKAKAILSGADYSLVQTAHKHLRQVRN